jgi:hippurate hydrolase
MSLPIANIEPQILAIARDMTKLRHAFHERPEIGFEEDYANSKIKELLNEWGLSYDEIAGTGLVVTLKGKQNTSGRVIGLRADMDALTVEEKTDTPWKSKNDGKMHACGHDGHMATMLTALSYLKDNRNFDGTVKIIFQPAEEGKGGAKEMIKDGLIENHKLDAMYAFHNWPDMEVGTAGIHTGPVMASNTNFEIILHGKGCHGGMPKQGNNPIIPSAELVLKLDTLQNEFAQTHPKQTVIISSCSQEAGSKQALNIIPDEAYIGGTIRTHNNEIKDGLPELITKTAQTIAENHGMTAQVTFPNICSPTVNNKDKAGLSRAAMAAVIGDENITWDAKPAMTAEDFGEFSNLIPICYIWIGNGEPNNLQDPHSQPLHSPIYDFNDKVIPIGAQYFINIIQAELPLTDTDNEYNQELFDPS